MAAGHGEFDHLNSVSISHKADHGRASAWRPSTESSITRWKWASEKDGAMATHRSCAASTSLLWRYLGRTNSRANSNSQENPFPGLSLSRPVSPPAHMQAAASTDG